MDGTATNKPDVSNLQWWTVREVANRLRVSEDTILRLIGDGKLQAKKVGAQWRIHTIAVDSFEQGGKPARTPPARPPSLSGDPLRLYGSSPAPSTGRNR